MALLVTYSAYWAKVFCCFSFGVNYILRQKNSPCTQGEKHVNKAILGGPFHTHLVVSMSVVTAAILSFVCRTQCQVPVNSVSAGAHAGLTLQS